MPDCFTALQFCSSGGSAGQSPSRLGFAARRNPCLTRLTLSAKPFYYDREQFQSWTISLDYQNTIHPHFLATATESTRQSFWLQHSSNLISSPASQDLLLPRQRSLRRSVSPRDRWT
jgi:hypothetical protein